MNKDQQINETFEKMSNNASESDIPKIEKKLDKMKRGPIEKVWSNVTILWKLIKDPHTAKWAKAIAIGALLYLVSPIDAIPDFIPGLGLTDDVAVILLAIGRLKMEIDKYKSSH